MTSVTETRRSAGLAPYDADGWLLHYPSNVAEWRPMETFTATLRLLGNSRGRSAVTFEWVDQDGRHWPMFVTDLTALVTSGNRIERARTQSLDWEVCKRGQNYGIRLITSWTALTTRAAAPQSR